MALQRITITVHYTHWNSTNTWSFINFVFADVTTSGTAAAGSINWLTSGGANDTVIYDNQGQASGNTYVRATMTGYGASQSQSVGPFPVGFAGCCELNYDMTFDLQGWQPQVTNYCVRPRICNGNTVRAIYTVTCDGGSLRSPILAPGECYQFPEICMRDKSTFQVLENLFLVNFDPTTGQTTMSSDGPQKNETGQVTPNWTTNTAPAGTSPGSDVPGGNTPNSTGANTNTVNDTPRFNSTNFYNTNIIYAANSNAATEGTLKSFADMTYKVLNDGFEQNRQGLANLLVSATNGNQIAYNGYSTISNSLRGLSNAIAGLGTNGGSGELNSNNINWVRFHASNTVVAVNNLTNYLNPSNSIITSGQKDTLVTSGTDAASGVKGDIDALSAGLSPTVGSTMPGAASMNISIGDFTFDCNPLTTYGGVIGGVASFCRQLFTWAFTLGFILACIKVTHGTMQASAAARQASAASATPGVSSGTALVMAGAITVAIATVPALLVTAMGGGVLSVLGASPWDGASGAIGTGIYLLNAFMPLDAVVNYAVSFVIFRFGAMGAFWVSSTITRFLVG